MKNRIKLLVFNLLLASGLFGQAPAPTSISLGENPLPIVTSLGAQYTGQVGNTTYCYWAIARYGVGNSQVSAPSCVGGINPSAGGSVTVSWQVPNIPVTLDYTLTYDILRTTSNVLSQNCENCLLSSATSVLTTTDSLGVLATGYTLSEYQLTTAVTSVDNMSTDQAVVYRAFKGVKNQSDIRNGTVLPVYCNNGDFYILTGAYAGQNLYACIGNSWVLQTQSPVYGAYSAFGDSNTQGGVGGVTSYANLFALNLRSNVFNNYGIGGYTAQDVSLAVTNYTNPDTSTNALYSVSVGTNDANVAIDANKQAVYTNAMRAITTWLTIPRANKVFAQDPVCTQTIGTWVADPSIRLGLLGIQTGTNGNRVSCVITSYGGPIYVGVKLTYHSTATANLFIDAVNEGTLIYSGPGDVIIPGVTNTGIAVFRYTGFSAGSHAVVITATSADASNIVNLEWIGTTPSVSSNKWGYPTALITGVIPWYNNTEPVAGSTLVYNNLAANVVNVAFSDGLTSYFVPLRNWIDPVTNMQSGSAAHMNQSGQDVTELAFETVLNQLGHKPLNTCIGRGSTVVSVTANYSIAASDCGNTIMVSGVGITVTLPNPLPSSDFRVRVLNVNTANAVVISRNSLTVNGGTSINNLPACITLAGGCPFADFGVSSDFTNYTMVQGGGLGAQTFIGNLLVQGGITTVGSGNNLNSAADIKAAASYSFYWDTRSSMQSPSNGVINLSNLNQTDFSRLQFGGTTSSFPSLKKVNTSIVSRLADDSADGPFQASAYIAGGTIPAVGTCGTIGTGSKNAAGFITSATTGSCVSVLTFSSVTAATGWSCGISNATTANLITQTGSSTTTATFTGTTISGDILRYVCTPY